MSETPSSTVNRRDVGRDEKLIQALVNGLALPAVANHAECSISTVERRFRDPEFQTRLIEAKNDLLDRLLGQSANGAMASTNYLLRVVIGEEPPEPGRIRAAIALRSGLDRLDAHITRGR